MKTGVELSELREGVKNLGSLQSLVPPAGLSRLEEVNELMDEMISDGYEPYFCGNAALHLSFTCQRCGMCCKDVSSIAVSVEDCRKIAKYLGMSLRKFMVRYTSPHSMKGRGAGNARVIRKAEEDECPFYDSSLPGCSIHQVKPQVCSAAFYLSKMNLLLCKENERFSTFPQCPSDSELRERIEEVQRVIGKDPEMERELCEIFRSSLPEVRLFHLLLRLKGMEIFFGEEKAAPLARKLGLRRLASDDELKPAAFLYVVHLLENEGEG